MNESVLKRMATFKMIVFGRLSVGRSTLVRRFVTNHFFEDYDPIVEDTYREKAIVDGVTCFFDILDCAGSEEYATMLRDLYTKQCQGILLVYDVTNRSTFDATEKSVVF